MKIEVNFFATYWSFFLALVYLPSYILMEEGWYPIWLGEICITICDMKLYWLINQDIET